MNIVTSWFCSIILKPLVNKYLIKEVRGTDNVPKSNFILTSNHQSHLDWLLSGVFCVPRRFTFIGQTDRYTGLLGIGRDFLYFIAGVIPINRKDSTSKKIALGKAIKSLEKGYILIIYPEGTRSRTGEVQKGKWGSAKIFLKTGVPILPIAFSGTYKLFPPGGKMTIGKSVRINIGKPLYFKEELEKAKTLTCDSEEYLDILKEITGKMMAEITALKAEID